MFAHAAAQWKRDKSRDSVQCFFLYCQPQHYSVLRRSISDVAQCDDELERNELALLHSGIPGLDEGHSKRLATRFLDC